MRLLLDTHVLLNLIETRTEQFAASVRRLLAESKGEFHVSVASLWEIAIKRRLGKLQLTPSLSTLPELLHDLGIKLVLIDARDVLASVQPNGGGRLNSICIADPA